MRKSVTVTVALWQLALLLSWQCIHNVCSSSLLLLKQRSRLDNLFAYEIKECVSSASLLSTGVWSASNSATTDPTDKFDYRSLSCVRSVINDIAFASTPQGLVDIVRSLGIDQQYLWTMEYECLAPLERIFPDTTNNENTDYTSTAADRKAFSSKTLFCALSQCIKGVPALDTRDAVVFYIILETAKGFHFGSSTESLSPLSNVRYSTRTTIDRTDVDSISDNVVRTKIKSESISSTESVKEFWAGRPFIFSAALNIEIAESVLNILKSRLTNNLKEKEKVKKEEMAVTEKVFTVLDPCCGSGTTMFVGRR